MWAGEGINAIRSTRYNAIWRVGDVVNTYTGKTHKNRNHLRFRRRLNRTIDPDESGAIDRLYRRVQ